MAGHGRKNCDDALILSLAIGASPATAAAQAGCSETTVKRRLKEPGFREKISAQRSELIQGAIGRLAGGGTAAADELYKLTREGSTEQIRLSAASALLRFMLQGHTNEVLAVELAALRQLVEGMKHGNGQGDVETGEGAAGEPGGPRDGAYP
jgi:hypothetical protein